MNININIPDQVIEAGAEVDYDFRDPFESRARGVIRVCGVDVWHGAWREDWDDTQLETDAIEDAKSRLVELFRSLLAEEPANERT